MFKILVQRDESTISYDVKEKHAKPGDFLLSFNNVAQLNQQQSKICIIYLYSANNARPVVTLSII